MEHDARRLAKAGFYIVPIDRETKRPLVSVYDATRSRTRLRWWRERWGDDINIAIAPDPRFWVMDIDPAGHEAFAALEREHGRLPDTIMALTPRRGFHYYLRQPSEGAPVTNGNARIARGIDCKAHGGYVIAPPSRRIVDGEERRYQWVFAPWEVEMAEAPEWLVELARRRPRPARAPTHRRNGVSPWRSIDSIIRRLLRADEGERNNVAYWCAARLGEHVANGGIDEEEALALILEAAEHIGLPHREAEATARSGLRAGGR